VLHLDRDVPLTPEARILGIAAAQLVFDQAGIAAYEAARASFRREAWDTRDFPGWLKPTVEQHGAADTWLAAGAAASAVSDGGVLCVDVDAPLEPAVAP
jgi:hypothetical protein